MKKNGECLNKLIKLVLIGLALLTCVCNKNEPTALESMIKTVGARRFIEARLSGGFNYGPLEISIASKKEKTNFSLDPFLLTDNKQSRGVNKREVTNKEDLFKQTKLIVYKNSNTNLDANNLYELGIVELLSGNYSQSIDYLEKALAQGLKNSKFLNDLACAYLESGKQKEHPADFIKALSLIDEAIDLDKNNLLIEAKFNKALVLEKLYLVSNAEKAWQEYLLLESNVNWKREGQLHLVKLKKETVTSTWLTEKEKLVAAIIENDTNVAQTIINQFPHQARICVVEELIPKWAKANQQIDRETTIKIVKVISFIGQKLFELQGDKELIDRANVVLITSQNIQKRSILANAYLLYTEGVKAFENYENEKATELFDQAIKGFSQVDDKASKTWAIFQRVRCDLVQSEYQKVFEKLKNIDDLVENNSYLYLQGRILWTKGLIYGYQFNLSKALEVKKVALSCLTGLRDIEGMASLNFLIASNLLNIGEKEDSWFYFYKALELFSSITNSNWRTGFFVSLPGYINAMGKLRIANYIYQEIKDEILKGNNETLKCFLLLEHSNVNYKLSRLKESLTELTTA